MPSVKLENSDFNETQIGILTLLTKAGFAASIGEARRLVIQGGVSVNDEKISDPKKTFNADEFKNDFILKKGKKSVIKIIL